MSIYNIQGNVNPSAYSVDGVQLTQSYNINGVPLLEPITLKVATYNVGSWYDGGHDNVPSAKDSDYLALQTGIIESMDADILLLQEYTQQFSKLPRTARSVLESYYPYIHEQGGASVTNTHGKCICSKYPITNVVSHTFANPGRNYIYVTCEITIQGVICNVIDTHLYWTNTDDRVVREAEIAELLTFMSNKSNVILGGDFNNGLRPDLTQEQWEDRYNRFVKPFTDEGYHTANYGDFGTFVTCIDTNNVEYSLDTIYVSSNIIITNAYADTTKITDNITDCPDHLPLIATLQIN